MTTMTTDVSRGVSPVSASEQAEASSTHARINIPLNLENWKPLDEATRDQLAWFHQYILAEHLGYEEVERALGYDGSTIFRVLKGTYEGSWPNVIRAIRKFRAEVDSLKKLEARRGSLQRCAFVENRVSKRVAWILGYTLDRAGASLVLGEGGVGKTACLKAWSNDNNHGRSVVVESLPIGGAKGLLRQIAEKVGVNKNLNTHQMIEAVVRAFNDTRILIVDEIQHHVPLGVRTTPTALEMVRRIKDLSGCALAMFGTVRVTSDLSRTPYFYEQIMRRTGKPYYLPDTFEETDVLPMVKQFIPRPTGRFMEVMLAWSNDRELGRLNYIVDMLTFASKLAHDNKKPLTEEMVLASHQMRENRSRK